MSCLIGIIEHKDTDCYLLLNHKKDLRAKQEIHSNAGKYSLKKNFKVFKGK